jgi:pSer/pThr/pTyr-binding forkhead associated (FHA) protein
MFCQDSIDQQGFTAPLPQREPEDHAMRAGGSARFGPEDRLFLHIADATEPLVVHLSKRVAVIGRYDPKTDSSPDIDLTPYDAMGKGVSRKHLEICRDMPFSLSIRDLNSANATYLNGGRLMPEQPAILRDGDQLRLGDLEITIQFDRQ